MCRTPRPVDEYEQTKAEHRENPADLARHSTAARQAHGDATSTDYVSCRVRLSGHGSWRRSGQSAIHGIADCPERPVCPDCPEYP